VGYWWPRPLEIIRSSSKIKFCEQKSCMIGFLARWLRSHVINKNVWDSIECMQGVSISLFQSYAIFDDILSYVNILHVIRMWEATYQCWKCSPLISIVKVKFHNDHIIHYLHCLGVTFITSLLSIMSFTLFLWLDFSQMDT